jgi:hypothetical protein
LGHNVLYLDFEKAFDRVPHQRLLIKLSHFGIRGHLLKWIQAFLSNRTFHVKVTDSISDERQVVSGVPQGSVLGPLLFVIYISDLSAVINVPHESWLLTLNSDKCKVLHLGKKNPAVQYFIDKKIITRVDSHNDLGVTITSDLSWSEHLIRIVKRTNTSSYVMFKAFSRPSNSPINREFYLAKGTEKFILGRYLLSSVLLILWSLRLSGVAARPAILVNRGAKSHFCDYFIIRARYLYLS